MKSAFVVDNKILVIGVATWKVKEPNKYKEVIEKILDHCGTIVTSGEIIKECIGSAKRILRSYGIGITHFIDIYNKFKHEIKKTYGKKKIMEMNKSKINCIKKTEYYNELIERLKNILKERYDEKDEKLIECAIAGGASSIILEDTPWTDIGSVTIPIGSNKLELQFIRPDSIISDC